MSNSPKYTVVELSNERAMARRAEQQRRAAALRDREARRVAEYQRLSAERARRALEAERAVIAARLAEAGAMVADLTDHPSAVLASDARALSAALAGLRERISTATDLAACLREAENLRARALELRGREREARRAAEFQRLSAERAGRGSTASAP